MDTRRIDGSKIKQSDVIGSPGHETRYKILPGEEYPHFKLEEVLEPVHDRLEAPSYRLDQVCQVYWSEALRILTHHDSSRKDIVRLTRRAHRKAEELGVDTSAFTQAFVTAFAPQGLQAGILFEVFNSEED